LRSLPRSALSADRCANIAAASSLGPRRAGGRSHEPDYLSTLQFTEGLVTLLPASRAADVLKDLRELRVAVFVVGTVREQMRYDTPRLIVEAGKPFEITFVNSDLMPHNLTIVTPGSRKRIGELAMKMKPQELDDRRRAYVPKDDAILAATRLLENGQRQNAEAHRAANGRRLRIRLHLSRPLAGHVGQARRDEGHRRLPSQPSGQTIGALARDQGR
jgi:hypothetical protein